MTAGRKVWSPFDVLTASDLNGYIADRGVMRFASAAARSSAIPSPEVGMLTWREDASPALKLEYWNGASWAAMALTSPAQTVQGQSSVQVFSGVAISAGTAADTWTSWANVGTSPGAGSYVTEVFLGSWTGITMTTNVLWEVSLDGGSTVWRRFITPMANGTMQIALPVTPRLCAASSTVHMRCKLAHACTNGATVALGVAWTTTVPAVVVSAAESLWSSASAGAAFGTWNTLGTVGAASRLVAAVVATGSTDAGLATGAGNTVLARWGNNATLLIGGNRAVPAGALKASGYSGSVCWALTEAV